MAALARTSSLSDGVSRRTGDSGTPTPGPGGRRISAAEAHLHGSTGFGIETISFPSIQGSSSSPAIIQFTLIARHFDSLLGHKLSPAASL